MKTTAIRWLSAALILLTYNTLQADTFFDGVSITPPLTLETFNEAPGPSIPASGGNPDAYLLLTEAVNNQHNWATFDRSFLGAAPQATFAFDFIIDPTETGPSADGFSFSFAPTATYNDAGGIGAPAFTAEDPAAAGVLGFGFDTWSNEGAHDTPGIGTGSDYQEISVFWDGAVVQRMDDTRTLDPPLTLDDAEWHSVAGTVDFAAGEVSLTVDGTSVFSGVAVPGLTPYENRIMFAARTGGENEIAGIDNLLVQYVPEPASGLLALLAGIASVMWRRRK